MLQLGYLALSMLLGRRLDPADYPAKVSSYFAELEKRSEHRAPVAPSLRRWIERALQIGGQSFASAQEANEAFVEVPKVEVLPEPKAHLVAVPAPDKSSEATPTPSASSLLSADEPSARSRKFSIATIVAAASLAVAVIEGVVIAVLIGSPKAVHVPPLDMVQPIALAAPAAPSFVVQVPAAAPVAPPRAGACAAKRRPPPR